MMKDLKLTAEHDIDLSQHTLLFVSDLDSIRQKLKIRLLFIFGEWFLDNTKGLKIRDILTSKNPNLLAIDNAIKATLQETTGVLEILYYTSTFSKQNRSFSVNFTVNTEYGILAMEEGIS